MGPKKAKKPNNISNSLGACNGSATCPSCSSIIDDNPLLCDICNDSYHPICVGFSVAMYDKFADMRDVVGWVCRECRIETALKFNKLQAAQASLAEEICSLKVEVEQIKEWVEVQKTKKPQTISYAEAMKTPEIKTELHMEVRNVIKDADRRSRNIAISGLKSITGLDDSALIEKLFEEELTVKPLIITNSCKRIGKEITGKPRRLLVTLGSSEEVDSVIKDARRLRNSTNNDTATNVFINRDLSPEEAKAAYEKRVQRRTQASVTVTNAPTAAAAAATMTSAPTTIPQSTASSSGSSLFSSAPIIPPDTQTTDSSTSH